MSAPGRIYAHCERDALALGPLLTVESFTVLVAPGRDGDLATAAAQGLGAHAVRGSSIHAAGSTLLRLAQAARTAPGPVAIVVDGPLGPSGRPKPGVLGCAAYSGRALVPLACAARPALVITGAWSRVYLPLPFARVALVLGPELIVSRQRLRDDRDALLEALRIGLDDARRRACTALAEPA